MGAALFYMIFIAAFMGIISIIDHVVSMFNWWCFE